MDVKKKKKGGIYCKSIYYYPKIKERKEDRKCKNALTMLKQNMRLQFHALFALLSLENMTSWEHILPGESKNALRCIGGDHKPLCS